MIWISRDLQSESPLLAWGRARGVQVRGQSLLRFEAVPFDPPPDADWWFFYSGRAVEFAGQPPRGVKTAALGSGTAAALLRRSTRVDYCGSGQPSEVADDFLAVGAGRRVFFPRARQSRLSVQKRLAESVTVLDAVCYDNLPDPPTEPIAASTFIFTSPLNVAAYLDHHSLPVGARVIAIGPTTARALQQRGHACETPDDPSEKALAELL